tara:strand:- start:236 stop:1135 length:900 start_codon:yes stop_codon:yes gene_type:complete
MPSPYNDVELTDSDKQSIYENPGIKEDQNPLEAGVDGVPTKGVETHETESPEGVNEASESETSELESEDFNIEDYEIEIDGEVYDGADILNWQKDSANKNDWQASNTQEAQKLAKWSKFTDKIASDDEFRDYIKDYFYEDDKGLKSLGLDGELTPLEVQEAIQEAEEQVQPDESTKAIEERLESIELERVVDDLETELDAIVENNPGLFKEEQDELDFLEFVENSKMVDLEDAFKVWAYDNLHSELDHHRKLDGNRQRNQGKVVHNSEIGATEVSTPKTYKSVKDIDIDDPDVAKYFNR